MPTTDSAPPVVTRDGNYTVDEAAAWLRCERQLISAAIRNGRLAAKKYQPTGRKYIITGAALLDYRDSLTDA